MAPSDSIRIQHILDALEESFLFAKGKSREDLNNDRILVLSLIKEIEIIGEAASKISVELKTKYSEIPWVDIIGMRNKLIHGYFEVNLDILWNTIKKDLPKLQKQLQTIIKNE